MKPLGFSIDQIGQLLGALDTVGDPGAAADERAAARAFLDEAHATAQARVAELRTTTERAEAFTERQGRQLRTV